MGLELDTRFCQLKYYYVYKQAGKLDSYFICNCTFSMPNMSKKGFAASDNWILATVVWFRRQKVSFLVGYRERKCAANKTRFFHLIVQEGQNIEMSHQ